jgi:hypothetical protein
LQAARGFGVDPVAALGGLAMTTKTLRLNEKRYQAFTPGGLAGEGKPYPYLCPTRQSFQTGERQTYPVSCS